MFAEVGIECAFGESMRRSPQHRLSYLALAVLFACQTESASDFATSAINADISATATGNGSTTVGATFRKGPLSLTFLELTSDDTLQVTSGTTTKTLSETSLLGLVTYSASVPVDTDGAMFTVSLQRKKDSGAPSSVATLPPAFTLTQVSGTFSRADAGPSFDWSPASDLSSQLTITGNCINDFSVALPANATSYSVAAGALTKRAPASDGGTQIPDDCDATAQVDHSLTGSLDKGYGGGSVVGIQRRTTTFGTAP
jgi:hypothetical protein